MSIVLYSEKSLIFRVIIFKKLLTLKIRLSLVPIPSLASGSLPWASTITKNESSSYCPANTNSPPTEASPSSATNMR